MSRPDECGKFDATKFHIQHCYVVYSCIHLSYLTNADTVLLTSTINYSDWILTLHTSIVSKPTVTKFYSHQITQTSLTSSEHALTI